MPRERDWDAIKQAFEDLELIEGRIAEKTRQIDTITDDLVRLKTRQEMARRHFGVLLQGTMPSDATASPSSNVEDSE